MAEEDNRRKLDSLSASFGSELIISSIRNDSALIKNMTNLANFLKEQQVKSNSPVKPSTKLSLA